ncbi:hypothetical protein ASF80_15540 [Microbacterium sp. Leaf159]|nr:hypothetical protein ASF80_15540 [Microbacterium sp. Leaf159]
MTDSFEVAVGGRASSLRAAGEWFRHGAESAGDAIDYTSGLNVSGPRSWSGPSAESFGEASRAMVEAARQITDIAGPFAEILHTYAGRVERMQEHFEGLLHRAAELGMRVDGTLVSLPHWQGPVPQSREDEGFEAWKQFTDLRREYQRIQIDVVEWHAGNEAWVHDNILLFAAGLPNSSLAEELLDALSEAAGVAEGVAEPLLDRSWEMRIENLRETAMTWREDADEMRRKAGVTRDPALRALLEERIAAKLPESMKISAGVGDSIADILRASRKVLPIAGSAVEIGLGVWDITRGEEPVDVAVGWGGAAAGGAGIAAGAVALGVGTGGVAVLASAGGAAIGGAVSGIWTTTPPSWREGIYSWTEDGFIVVGDIGEDVGDWFVDRWMDLSGDVPR